MCGLDWICLHHGSRHAHVHTYIDPPHKQLMDLALSAASGREALMMLQGALSSKPMPGMFCFSHA